MRSRTLAAWAAVALAALSASAAGAQVSVVGGRLQLDTLAAQYRADFAVPEAPALDLVDGDPSALLRPASVRAFALAASEFAAPDGGVRVPEALAVEVAPFLLARGRRLSIGEYLARPALYRLRLSGATGRDSAGRAAVALGVRATVLDDADLRARADYREGVTAITRRIVDLVVAERLARAAQGERPGAPLSLADLTGERAAGLDAALAAVDSLRRAVEEESWNARVLEVAAGARARAADSAGNGLRATDYAAWATYGDGIGAWGQVLVGARGALVRDEGDSFAASASLSARLYVGSNRAKGFAEGQVAAGRGAAGFVQAGAEARLLDAVWATLATGVEWDGGARLVGRFALKLALPDLAE